MRLWHYKLLPYLPDMQLKGQLRELVAIMHDWRDKGHTNHLLINKVMEYDKKHLTSYFLRYSDEYYKRYGKEIDRGITWEFLEFANYKINEDYTFSIATNDIISIRLITEIFPDWHNEDYLRVCMANLYEKYHFGVGKSKILQAEWDKLLQGYKSITSNNYVL